MTTRTLDDGLRPTGGERLRAWALTGPPGRAWSFGFDLVVVLGALLAHAARRRSRRP